MEKLYTLDTNYVVTDGRRNFSTVRAYSLASLMWTSCGPSQMPMTDLLKICLGVLMDKKFFKVTFCTMFASYIQLSFLKERNTA